MSVLDKKCQYCGKPAVWYYTAERPGERAYCEDCVPRGCACQKNPDGTPGLDSDGRELPCCEYMKLRNTLTVLSDEDHPENAGRKFTVAEWLDCGLEVPPARSPGRKKRAPRRAGRKSTAPGAAE